VSGAIENRAAVFTSSPQDVEVYRDGTWWAGSLLGWRHDAAGGCQVWVRAEVRGVEETSWLALDLLRLPEPAARPERHLAAVGAGNAADVDTALTGTMAAIRAVPVPRSRARGTVSDPSALSSTMNLVAVRDVPGEDAAEVAPRRPGGRRRAPEPPTGEQPAVAPEQTGPVIPGRHRAPAPGAVSAGRHRAADTGVWPAVRNDEPAHLTELPRRRPPLPALDEPDSHLLTRPMRLGDALDGGVPQPRRAYRDGRLSGV
jgi:hypothetical protein